MTARRSWRSPASSRASWKMVQSLLDEDKAKSWTVVDMKSDWKKFFAFEP